MSASATGKRKTRNPTKYKIGDEHFGTLDAMRAFGQRLLHESPSGAVFRPGTAEFRYLYDLLARHPSSEAKIGCGVAEFFVDNSANSRCFHVRRTDKSEEEFSYNKCVWGPQQKQDRTKALRHAVIEQMVRFKNAEFAQESLPRCAISDAQIYNRQDCEVDHHPIEFQQLVKNFFAEEETEFDDIQIQKFKGGKVNMVDKELKKRWQKYHADHARMRLLLITQHRQKTLKRYEKS